VRNNSKKHRKISNKVKALIEHFKDKEKVHSAYNFLPLSVRRLPIEYLITTIESVWNGKK